MDRRAAAFMSTKSIPQKSPKSKPVPHFTLQEQRSKWVARFKLPDGFRAAFTVGPTAGPDRMTVERARETLRSFFERGLVDRLMAERTRETKAPRALTLGDVADKWATLIAKDTKLAPSTRAGHRLAAEGIITERSNGDDAPVRTPTPGEAVEERERACASGHSHGGAQGAARSRSRGPAQGVAFFGLGGLRGAFSGVR